MSPFHCSLPNSCPNGADEEGAGTFAAWYEGIGGQLVSVLGLVALVAACFFLATKGARWQLEEEQGED